MAWDAEIPLIIRHMVDDLSDTPTYSDSRLQELVLVGGQLLQQEVDFPNVYVIDVDARILTPDPTSREAGTRDDGFVNLTSLKCACILLRAELKTSAGQAIMIKDGSSMIDLKNVALNKKLAADMFCKAFEDAVFLYKAGNRDAGSAIVSPYRLGLYSVYNYGDDYQGHHFPWGNQVFY